MKTGVIITVGCILLFALGVFTGLIGLHYPRGVNNQTLVGPITISKIEGDNITLEDGRILELIEPIAGEEWASVLNQNPSQIEVEAGQYRDVTVWGNVPTRVTLCGGTCPIRIPLIGHDVNLNRRRVIGIGLDVTGITQTAQAEQAGADQSSTKPADKPPVKGEPSPPTPKGAPQ